MESEKESAPVEIREGIRSGILSSITQDVEKRGGRTARLLLAAGVVGAIGAIGATLLISGHPYGHHPPWHVTVFATVWAGMLFVSLAIALLEVRTPSLPLARACSIGILGLGFAGVCGALCPDQHFLHWWSDTNIGRPLTETGGIAVSAACFGFVSTLVFGGAAGLIGLVGRTRPMRPLLPAAVLAVLLAPGVALQSVGTSVVVLVGWLVGTGAGAYLGIAGAIRVRALLTRPEA